MFRRILTLATLTITFSLLLFALPTPDNAALAQGKDKNARGKQLFIENCAVCHGANAQGGGPAAPALKTQVPNLTRIPYENGKFPMLRVQNVISGEVMVPAHGSREMPIWGSYFRAKTGTNSMSIMNVHALAAYIESIQQK